MSMLRKKNYNIIPYWGSWIWAEEQKDLWKVKRKDLLRKFFVFFFFSLYKEIYFFFLGDLFLKKCLYKEIYRLTADILENKASPDSLSRF